MFHIQAQLPVSSWCIVASSWRGGELRAAIKTFRGCQVRFLKDYDQGKGKAYRAFAD